MTKYWLNFPLYWHIFQRYLLTLHILQNNVIQINFERDRIGWFFERENHKMPSKTACRISILRKKCVHSEKEYLRLWLTTKVGVSLWFRENSFNDWRRTEKHENDWWKFRLFTLLCRKKSKLAVTNTVTDSPVIFLCGWLFCGWLFWGLTNSDYWLWWKRWRCRLATKLFGDMLCLIKMVCRIIFFQSF